MKTKITIQYNNTSTYIYEMGIFLLSFSTMIRKSLLNEYTGWMSCFTYISWMCMIYRMFCIKNTGRKLFVQTFFILLASVIYVSAESLAAGTLFLKVFSSEEVEEKKTMRVAFVAFLCGIIIVIICALLGVIPMQYGRGNSYTFGFRNINGLISSIGMLIMMHVYLHYEKLDNKKIVMIILINTLILLFTKSKTTCIGLYIVVFIILNLKNLRNMDRFTKCMAVFIILVTFFLLIGIISYNTRSLFWNGIDIMMTGRISQANYYYIRYPLSLFGNVIPELNSTGWHWLLDIGFFSILELGGIVYGVLVMYLIYGSLFQRIKWRDYPTAMFLLYVAIHLMSESYFTDMNISMAPIFFGPFLFAKRRHNHPDMMERME